MASPARQVRRAPTARPRGALLGAIRMARARGAAAGRRHRTVAGAPTADAGASAGFDASAPMSGPVSDTPDAGIGTKTGALSSTAPRADGGAGASTCSSAMCCSCTGGTFQCGPCSAGTAGSGSCVTGGKCTPGSTCGGSGGSSSSTGGSTNASGNGGAISGGPDAGAQG